MRIKRPKLKFPNGHDSLMMLTGAVIVLIIVGIVNFAHAHRTPMPYQPLSSPWIPSTVKYWQTPINEEAKKYNIDADFVAIIMTMESGGDASAVSPDNAQGLMQVTPATAKDIASRYLKKPVKSYNLKDPKTNIEFGVAYLAELRKLYGETSQGPSWDQTAEIVAAGYNGGFLASAHLEDGKGLHDDQTIVYSRDAYNMWRERHASDSPTFDRWKERGGSNLIQAAEQRHQ
ncbi:MAG TPA: transglycosylase SLT domain-containing protein [Candidatus Saccharimonadales bacterium]|nr:transglycosylase SLT domain-containing protein [Candidatus Saccharimonadales bacterium]